VDRGQPNVSAACADAPFSFQMIQEGPEEGVCEVNVIDNISGNFAFPRWPILIKAAAPPPAVQSSATSGQ
jgi:hypothetical protein